MIILSAVVLGQALWNPPASKQFADARREVEILIQGRKRFGSGYPPKLKTYARAQFEVLRVAPGDRIAMYKGVLAKTYMPLYEMESQIERQEWPKVFYDFPEPLYKRIPPQDYEEFRAEVLSDVTQQVPLNRIMRVFSREKSDPMIAHKVITANIMMPDGNHDVARETAKAFADRYPRDAQMVGLYGFVLTLGSKAKGYDGLRDVPAGMNLLKRALTYPTNPTLKRSLEMYLQAGSQRLAFEQKKAKVGGKVSKD